MSRVLFIGDMHLKLTQFELSKRFLSHVETVIAEQQPDIVVNLGDTFDTHGVIRAEIMSEYVSHVERVCLNKKIKYIHILGNHEMCRAKDNTYTALQPIRKIAPGQFFIIDKISHVKLDGTCTATFVPYLIDMGQFPTQTHRLCIAHQSFIGADYGYHRPDVGVDADNVSAELIVSGHIHKRQSFGKVIYPGSPFAVDCNDVDQTKGLLILDTDTYATEFLEVPLPRWRSLSFIVSEAQTIDNIHKILSKTLNDQDHFVVNLTGFKAELQLYLKSKRYLSLIDGKHIIPKPSFLDQEKAKVVIKATSMSSIVSEYIEKVYSGQLDKDSLKSAAYDIIKSI